MSASQNVRIAILKAADFIESKPELYSFWNLNIPDCGTPGCMLGWIGYFGGIKKCGVAEVERFLGTWQGEDTSKSEFYRRVDKIGNVAGACSLKAHQIPKVLREYANLYHPAEPSRELPSGAEVCRELIRRPWKETEAA